MSDDSNAADQRRDLSEPSPVRGARESIAPPGSRKRAEATDPLELTGNVVPGDVEYLARCFIEEFAAIGHDAASILRLFRDPRYVAVHGIYRHRGEPAVRRLISDVLAECGVLRATVTAPDRSPPRKLAQIEVSDDSGGERR